MSNWYDQVATFTELDETIVVGRPAFVASFYAHAGLRNHAQALFDAWLALLPPKATLYYSHSDTKRYSRLNPKAIAKIRDVLAPPSVGTKFRWYHAKSAAPDGPADEGHAYSFEIYAAPDYSGYVYVTFPRDHVDGVGVEAVLSWFCEWSEKFSMTHAIAGFGYEVAWFDEQAQAAYPVMLATALRFHGVQMWNQHNARFRERTDNTLDTASWLTYLDRSSLDKLEPGAIERIADGVVRHPCGKGVVLQAGPLPDPADTNRRGPAWELLKSVNDAIVPIRTRKWWINRFATEPDKENGWFSRMDT